jgi:hypothetical protein
MTETFGAFRSDLPEGNEYLILRFSPSSVPVKERWRNNSLSADFMADYMATFFPGDSTNIKSAVSFVANELIENAMKYHDYASEKPITIALFLHSDKLIFQLTNTINVIAAKEFQEFITLLTTSDPSELYIQQLEANSEEGSGDSGLGFLTMINDYQAELGWQFEPVQGNEETKQVVTLVQLPSEFL